MKKVVKEAKDLKLPWEKDTEDYKTAIERYKQWKEDYGEWEVKNYYRIKYHNLPITEQAILIKTYNYILKNYDTNLDFEHFITAILCPLKYDIRGTIN